MEVILGPGHIVLDGHPPIQFSAHVFSGQTAGWINMPLGTEVGLGPGDIVLVYPAPKRVTAAAPTFGPCLLWPNGRPSQQLLRCNFSAHSVSPKSIVEPYQ